MVFQKPQAVRITLCCLVAAALTLISVASLSAVETRQKFFPDDPIAIEPDPADASGVQDFPIHLTWDIVSSLFVKQGSPALRPAQNVNTVGDVPDSSWFINRVGSLPLTAEDVFKGPNTTMGPAPGPWTVVSGKSEGIRPGFTIVDSNGIRWFLKFDAPGYPEQATSAEVVSTKLFWALGYNVAETHVARLNPKELQIGDKATIHLNGKRYRLTFGDVLRVLEQAERSSDGTYRVIASKELEGKPVGGFLYYSTRSDDPNDIIPHEDRRELRGMSVFAAWIDRVDAKAGNTLDTLVKQDGHTVVRHHVLDFGSTLGSAGIGPNEYWEGFAYLYEGRPLAKKIPGFGFPVEEWRKIPYPELRGVGRLDGDRFDPEKWKSRVPNASYLRADPIDTFWAARKVMAVTDSMIAAAVRSGEYSDPAAESYLVRTLIKRRDAIGNTYLTKINPVVDPILGRANTLSFRNAAVDAHFVPAKSVQYDAAWFTFDNRSGSSTQIGVSAPSENPAFPTPGSLPSAVGSYIRVDIRSLSADYPSWSAPVQVFMRLTNNGWAVAGIHRTSWSGVAPVIPSASPISVR